MFPSETNIKRSRTRDKGAQLRLDSDVLPAALAAKAIRRIADAWGLSRRELAGFLRVSPATVERWQGNPPNRMSADTEERIAHLVAIYDRLHTIFSDASYANRWIYQPNRAFAEKAPRDLLVSGSFTELIIVREYLEEALAL